MRLVVLLLAFASTSSALVAQTKVRVGSGGGIQREVIDPSAVRVIIELREPPLLKHGGETRAAAADLDALLERLENDLRGGTFGKTGQPRLHHRYVRTFAGASATVPANAIRDIRALPYIKRVHVDRLVEAHLERSVPHIGAPSVWTDLGVRGAGVTVAVIDTGIDYTHAAFGGRFGPGARVVGGYDFVNDDADPIDDAGHGTHVAGIIGGNGGGVLGVAPEVTLIAYKVLNENGAGFESDVIAAVERSVDPNGDHDTSDRADIVNMSLGRSGSPDDPGSMAVQTASESGTLFVIAAGNSSRFFGIGTPGGAPAALTVGASNRDHDAIANFSTRGPVASSGAIKPEIVAPGVGIVSAAYGGGLLTASGTSMAAPHVAGVAALVKALHPGWTGARIKSAIVSSAVAIDAEAMVAGAGRVSAPAAVASEISTEPSVISFGVDDLSLATWTASAVVRLRNTGTRTITLTPAVTGTDANIRLQVEPSSVSVAPNATHDVTLRLSVDNGAFPTPREGSLSFGGRVLFEGDGSRVNLPWAFVKAARARISAPSLGFTEINFVGTDTFLQFFAGDEVSMIVPPGDYEVIVQSAFPHEDARSVILESQRVEAEATFEVTSEMASTTIALEAEDPAGARLESPARQCINETIIVLPAGSEFEWLFFSHIGPLRISPVSNRYRLLPMEICWSDADRAMLIAQHDEVEDAAQDSTLTVDASQWARQRVRVYVPEGSENPWAYLIGGALWRKEKSYGLGGWGFVTQVHGGAFEGSLYLTPDIDPEFGAAAFVETVTNEPGQSGSDDGPPSYLAVDTPMLRRIDDDTFASMRYLTPEPLLYESRAGDELRFGRAALFPRANVAVNDEGRFAASVIWQGQLEEFVYPAFFNQLLTLKDAQGTIVRSGYNITSTVLAPGPYVLESRVGANVGGTTGQLQVTATFDTTRADSSPPSLSLMRIAGADAAPAEFLTQGEGRLSFAMADLVPNPDGPGTLRASVAPAVTRAWARLHGMNEWQPLTLTHEGDDVGTYAALGHVATGSVFRADLRTFTATSVGPVDLRIESADGSGNTIEFVAAPAFHVAAGRRRSAEP